MAKKIMRFVIALIGSAIFVGALFLLSSVISAIFQIYIIQSLTIPLQVILFIVVGLAGAALFFFLSNKIIALTMQFFKYLESTLSAMPIGDIFAGVIGLMVGLIIALLLSNLINLIPIQWLASIVSVFSYIVLIYLGISVAVNRKDDISQLREDIAGAQERASLFRPKGKQAFLPKILDTSVIIDGRIYDITKTGILEGKLLVPGFVLEEIRHIADSADATRRQRGRRGLDILNAMQEEFDSVVVLEKDYENLEVDDKLIELTKEQKGKLVTNDLNLSKVAKVKGVEVINVNELASAVKPAVLPGEEMEINIIRDGEEAGQGVGYLDDGTMIVVEGGKSHIGATKLVYITSVLQTSGGRMIFAKLKDAS